MTGSKGRYCIQLRNVSSQGNRNRTCRSPGPGFGAAGHLPMTCLGQERYHWHKAIVANHGRSSADRLCDQSNPALLHRVRAARTSGRISSDPGPQAPETRRRCKDMASDRASVPSSSSGVGRLAPTAELANKRRTTRQGHTGAWSCVVATGCLDAVNSLWMKRPSRATASHWPHAPASGSKGQLFCAGAPRVARQQL